MRRAPRGDSPEAVRRTEAKRSPQQPDPHASGKAAPELRPASRAGHAQSQSGGDAQGPLQRKLGPGPGRTDPFRDGLTQRDVERLGAGDLGPLGVLVDCVLNIGGRQPRDGERVRVCRHGVEVLGSPIDPSSAGGGSPVY